MVKSTSLTFDDAVRNGERLILIAYFANAYGTRIWGAQYPPSVADARTDEHFADGTWQADGSIKAGTDLGGMLERAARIISFGEFEEGNPETSFENSTRRSDPARLRIALSNDDLGLSAVEAEENILSARVVLAAVPGGSSDPNDMATLADLRVVDYELTREELVLECEEV